MKVMLSVTVDVDNDDMTINGNRSGDSWASIALIPSLSAIMCIHSINVFIINLFDYLFIG